MSIFSRLLCVPRPKRHPSLLQEAHVGKISLRSLRKSNLEEVDEEGRTTLHVACAFGNLDEVQMISNEMNRRKKLHLLDARDLQRNTALHLAAGRCNYQMIEALVYAGANIYLRNERNLLPWMCLPIKNNKRVMMILGVDIWDVDSNNYRRKQAKRGERIRPSLTHVLDRWKEEEAKHMEAVDSALSSFDYLIAETSTEIELCVEQVLCVVSASNLLPSSEESASLPVTTLQDENVLENHQSDIVSLQINNNNHSNNNNNHNNNNNNNNSDKKNNSNSPNEESLGVMMMYAILLLILIYVLS